MYPALFHYDASLDVNDGQKRGLAEDQSQTKNDHSFNLSHVMSYGLFPPYSQRHLWFLTFGLCAPATLVNKAGYTATEVACGWAGAIFKATPSFGQEQ